MAYCRKEKSLEVLAYVIMTNHVHVIFKSAKSDLSGTVRDFKKHTSKQILKTIKNIKESRIEWLEIVFKYHAKYNKRNASYQLWTHENHAVELTDNLMLVSRIDYIHQNPVRAGWVEKAEDYLYSSARNFSKLDYLLQIDEI